MNPTRSPFTVIVAEKDPVARAALAALLSYDGYRVFQADNVEVALSCINRNDDLAVLLADLDMPAWQTIVRVTVSTTNALVIAMEENHRPSAMGDLNEHGIRVCLAKPIIYNDLRALIREHLGLSTGADMAVTKGNSASRKKSA
jgi:DNA-binding response OmpR family regulator